MKSLKDILSGTKKSKVVDGSTGTEPNVDYAAADKGSRDATAKHKVEKHEDRVGNDDVPYEPKTKKAKFARHGGETKTYEEVEPITELSKKTLGSYVKKASEDSRSKSVEATKRYNKHHSDYDYEGGDKARNADLRSAEKLRQKSLKRQDGVSKATDKLTKEETTPKAKDPESTKTSNSSSSDTTTNTRKRNPKFDPRKDDENDKFSESTVKSLRDILEISRGTVSNYIDKAVDDKKDRRPGLKLALKKKHGDAKVPAKKEEK